MVLFCRDYKSRATTTPCYFYKKALDYNKPVGFRLYNGETLAGTRSRIEDALQTFQQMPLQAKPLTIPDGYQEKMAKKGIKPAD
jgi:hypothetical protein